MHLPEEDIPPFTAEEEKEEGDKLAWAISDTEGEAALTFVFPSPD